MITSILIALISVGLLLIVLGIAVIGHRIYKRRVCSRGGLRLICSSLIIILPIQVLYLLISIPRGGLVGVSQSFLEFEKLLSQEALPQIIGSNAVILNALSIITTFTFSFSVLFSVAACVNILLLIRIMRRDYNPAKIYISKESFVDNLFSSFNSTSVCRLNI